VTNIADKIVPVVGGIIAVIFLTAGLSFLVGFLTWKLVLRSKPLRVSGSVLIFVVSALSAVGIYGHAVAPAVILLLILPEARADAVFWMLLVGFAVTCLFVWWSHRRRCRVDKATST
jgi:hypothetical protein